MPADDITMGPRTGRAVIAHDNIGGVHHQRVKVQHGIDGSATDVSTASPLPVVAALATNAIQDGLTVLTPKFAAFDAGLGDIAVVAAVADKKIRLLAALIGMDTTGTVRFEDGAAGNALTGIIDVLADGPFVLPFCPVGWLETSVNTVLSLEAAVGGASGMVVYIEV